jgi:molecular chaperone GrpE
VVKLNIRDENEPKEKREGREGDSSIDEQKEECQEEKEEKLEIPLEQMTKTQLINKIEEMEKLSEDNYNLYVRSQAEIENIKKRHQKEKGELSKFSNELLIKQLLTVIDNFEQAIAFSVDNDSIEAVKEGLELTLKGLSDILEKQGLEVIDAAGDLFDPNFHQAILEQEDNAVDPGTVIQQLQKGYLLNGRLIRPATVVVSKKGT